MMELSANMPKLELEEFARAKRTTREENAASQLYNDLIDLSLLDFDDDENWLLDSPGRSEEDFIDWLYSSDSPKFPSHKILDSRTFTRPKKRFTRPSIERYNEELFSDANLCPLSDSGIHINGSSQENSPGKPLQFDLSQPTSSFYFEKILANSAAVDSFQNMSPPSLVNSMCSSTFTTLMENSMIKNDPVLREIRDTDFTPSILQQEFDPMYQSMTGSCSSVNSDNPENFLKKVAFNGTFTTEYGGDVTLTQDLESTFRVTEDAVQKPANGTFQRKPRKSTFRVADLKNSTLVLNRRKGEDLNVTKTVTNPIETFRENTKRLLDRRASPSMDLNRLRNQTETSPMKNSHSSDSADNLDYLSASSGSSRSPKTVSVEDINMIIERQERSLNIMSTPIHKSTNFLKWDKLSPISGRNSDPELSSNELVMSPTNIRKQKSLCNISPKAIAPRSILTMKKPQISSYAQPKVPSPLKVTNLNSIGQRLKGSYTSLKPINPNLPVAPPLNTTRTMESHGDVTQIVIKEKTEPFVKPAPGRASALPRPAIGIPRPASRIPGPRSIPKPLAQGKYN